MVHRSKRVKAAWCHRESKPAIGRQSCINLIAHVDHDVIERRNRQYRDHGAPPVAAGADAIATAGRSPAPQYVNKMTALRRAPPSLGGKRHAAMAGSHPPRRRHCAGLQHVKVTVASGISPSSPRSRPQRRRFGFVAVTMAELRLRGAALGFPARSGRHCRSDEKPSHGSPRRRASRSGTQRSVNSPGSSF
jgi:hypothetical protein